MYSNLLLLRESESSSGFYLSHAQTSPSMGLSLLCHFFFHVQPPANVLAALSQCLAELPAAATTAVSAIQVTGQMHGVLAWDSVEPPMDPATTTTCITWQDQYVR